MNIVLLGHDDAASLFAHSLLVRSAPAHRYSAFLSGSLGGGAPHPSFAQLAAFDRDICTRLRAHPSFPSVLAAAEDLPSPNSPDGLERLAAAAPDVIVSIRYRRILRDAAIGIPRNGVLNLHSGILPDYKGVMATFWAMLAGETEVGCTLHRIVDAGIDTGPVLGIARRGLQPGSSYLENLLALYPAGVALVAEALAELAAGRQPVAQPQPERAGAYFSAPDGATAERFAASGRVLANGTESVLVEKFFPGD